MYFKLLQRRAGGNLPAGAEEGLISVSLSLLVEYYDIMKQKNPLISLIKLFLAYEVALGHADLKGAYVSGGACVNSFFIISGFFLVNSFHSGKYASAGEYTLNRLKKTYPRYILSFVLLFFFQLVLYGTEDILISITKALPEVFLLQNVGWFDGGINYPLWFLCDLIVISHLLFFLISENERLTVNVICPLLVLLFGAYYVNPFQDHEVVSWGVQSNFFYVPLWRTACFLSLGMIVDEVMPAFSKLTGNGRITKRKNCFVLVLLALASFILWLHARNTVDAYLPFILLLMSSSMLPFEKLGRMNLFNAVSRKADRLSLQVFFNHALVIDLHRKVTKLLAITDRILATCLFLVLLTVFSFFCEFTVSSFEKKKGLRRAV